MRTLMNKVAIASILLVLGSVLGCNGCNGQTTTMSSISPNESGDAGGSGGSSGSAPDEDNLTRAEFALMLVKNLLGIQSIGPNVCPSKWDDVPSDSELCFAVKMLADADVAIVQIENGKTLVKPGDTLPWQDAWQLTVQTAGWIAYPDKCLEEKGMASSEASAWYAGALCSRGLLANHLADATVKTKDAVNFMQMVKSFQDKPATRFDTIELIGNRLLGFKYDKDKTCMASSFSDVKPEMTLYCQLTEFMVKQDLIQGYPDSKFRGDNNVNAAEYVKLLTLSAKLDHPSCKQDACAGTAAKDQWYCSYAQAICDTGVVDSIVPINPIDRDFLTITAIEMKKFLAKLSPKDAPSRSI